MISSWLYSEILAPVQGKNSFSAGLTVYHICNIPMVLNVLAEVSQLIVHLKSVVFNLFFSSEHPTITGNFLPIWFAHSLLGCG